jgi:hypothetical protein
VGHSDLLASWDALRRRGMLLAGAGSLVVGLPAIGALVVGSPAIGHCSTRSNEASLTARSSHARLASRRIESLPSDARRSAPLFQETAPHGPGTPSPCSELRRHRPLVFWL